MRVCLLFFRIYIKLFLTLCITALFHNRRNIKITTYRYTKKKKNGTRVLSYKSTKLEDTPEVPVDIRYPGIDLFC